LSIKSHGTAPTAFIVERKSAVSSASESVNSLVKWGDAMTINAATHFASMVMYWQCHCRGGRRPLPVGEKLFTRFDSFLKRIKKTPFYFWLFSGLKLHMPIE